MKSGFDAFPSLEARIQDREPVTRLPIWGLVLLALFLVGLGISLISEPLMTAIAMVALGIGIPAAVLVWLYPEVGAVLLVFLGAQILHPELVDLRLPIGGGLELPDLLLVGLMGLLVLKQLLRGRTSHKPRSRMVAPLLILLALALFSTARAILLYGVDVSESFSELRGIVYYITLLLIIWELGKRERITRLFIGLYVVAAVIVAIMIGQQFLGSIPLVAGQETTGWQIIDFGGANIIRIRPPAHLLLYYLSIVAFALIAFSRGTKRKMAMLALALLLNIVLLLTFTRAQWLASAMAILICVAFFSRQARIQLAFVAVATFLLGIAFVWINMLSVQQYTESNTFVGPLMLRVQSMMSYDETLNSYSVQTRGFQTEAALDSISRNPILGVGMGNAYRRLTPVEAQSRNTRFTRFMENSYLYVATKMGIPALAIFVWLIAMMIAGSYRGLKSAQDPTAKAIGVATFATLVGLVFWGLTHPVLFLPEHTLMVGLFGGIGEAVWIARA